MSLYVLGCFECVPVFLWGGGVGTVAETKFLWVDFCHLGLVASPVFVGAQWFHKFLLQFRRSRDVCR